MPENSWPERKAYNELEPISSLTSDLSESEDIDSHFYRGQVGRRRKAAMALSIIWSSTIALHLLPWGSWIVLGLTTVMSLHGLRVLLAHPLSTPDPLPEKEQADLDNEQNWPYVSLLVAAKNEEAVIVNLVKALCSLDYPACRYDLWLIDDNSTDRTPMLLDQLAKEYEQLHVIHRSAGAGGGKSGALNQVWQLTQGEILGVFDADAQVPEDLLRRVLPLFQRQQVGAVQVRKTIANADQNFWTKGQQAEMALDAYFQQQRIAVGGIGELRGNGQFVRRQAVAFCGGWNEETITDDLDLTLRLHLSHWDVDFLIFPAVEEEGVTQAISLWHQRNRWGEGGYQRYLDYWRLIARNRLGPVKTLDLFMFWMTQYLLPTATIPDFLMAIARNRLPILSPVTGLTLTMSLVGMFIGLRRIRKRSAFVAFLQAVRGTFYMLHWFVIVASVTARMSVRPKRLKWVKTIHQGSDEVQLDTPV
ncbi:MAG: glycosyltransferase family 2 protein [Cyanothece sp. SIO1E1]|nr:glycosyltransferase family 2 protein [Cyanothece sp. SIO1E1]